VVARPVVARLGGGKASRRPAIGVADLYRARALASVAGGELGDPLPAYTSILRASRGAASSKGGNPNVYTPTAGRGSHINHTTGELESDSLTILGPGGGGRNPMSFDSREGSA
jgi:hypothetical protein